MREGKGGKFLELEWKTARRKQAKFVFDMIFERRNEGGVVNPIIHQDRLLKEEEILEAMACLGVDLPRSQVSGMMREFDGWQEEGVDLEALCWMMDLCPFPGRRRRTIQRRHSIRRTFSRAESVSSSLSSNLFERSPSNISEQVQLEAVPGCC
eukprot:764838-Hanusia_phi.AAC.2